MGRSWAPPGLQEIRRRPAYSRRRRGGRGRICLRVAHWQLPQRRSLHGEHDIDSEFTLDPAVQEYLRARERRGALSFREIGDEWIARLSAGEVAPAAALNLARWLVQRPEAEAAVAGAAVLARLARDGDRRAAFWLGVTRFGERGPLHDPAAGNALMREVVAQEREDADLLCRALCVLGDSFRLGRGCDPDCAEALRHYRTAARMGDAYGAFHAGLYYHGKLSPSPVAGDLDEAARFYAVAADRFTPARTNLGLLHGLGALRDADPAYGRRLLREAIADGDPAAEAALRSVELHARGGAGDRSSIPPGAFPEGARLPADHPDRRRIVLALCGVPPDGTGPVPQQAWLVAPGAMPAEALAELERREMAQYPAGEPEYRADGRLRAGLLDLLSKERAAGALPDGTFARILAHVMTPEGRRRLAEIFTRSRSGP